MAVNPIEKAVLAALANPDEALKFIDGLLGSPVARLAELMREMSDVERDFICLFMRHHIEENRAPSAKEVRAVGVILGDLAERRRRGEIPMDRHERRAEEGWWGFLDLLRAFAAANRLPAPSIDHGLDGAYVQQLVRDLLENYGVTTRTPGVPLSDWAPEDRVQMLGILARVNKAQTRIVPSAQKAQP